MMYNQCKTRTGRSSVTGLKKIKKITAVISFSTFFMKHRQTRFKYAQVY